MRNIIPLLFSLLLIYLLPACDYLKSKELSPEKKFELAQKCSEAGQVYFKQFARDNDDVSATPRWLWDNPEFHYNSRLNTCLIHIRYIHFNNYDFTTEHRNQVIDVFANKPILYGWFTSDNKKQTEILLKAYPDSVPNYTSIEYFDQKDKLFRE